MKEAVQRTTKNRGICNFYEKMEENLCLIWMAMKPHTAKTACFPCLFFWGMDSLTEDTVNCGHPVPGCVFVEAEAGAGKQRRSTIGYHNT